MFPPIPPLTPYYTPDKDILYVLLWHEDNEGIIENKYIGMLADRLEMLYIEDDEMDELKDKFIEGLRRAEKRHQKITFMD